MKEFREKRQNEYMTNSNHSIKQTFNARDLGALIFKYHNDVNIATSRKIIGWITRTFKTKDAKPMMGF